MDTPSLNLPNATRNLAASQRDRRHAAATLYRSLAPQHGNSVVATQSLVDAFSLLYASTSGTTAEEIRRGLGWQLAPADHPQLPGAPASASGSAYYRRGAHLWTQLGLPVCDAFRRQLATHGDLVAATQVDFAAAPQEACETINAWARELTRGKVQTLLPTTAVRSTTRFVLTAASYFKAHWQYRLTPAQMRFAGVTGEVPSLRFRCNHAWFDCETTEAYEAVRLPYRDTTASMLLIKPRHGLQAFEASLDGDSLACLMRTATPRCIDLQLPRFEVTAKHDLLPAMKSLGMRAVCDFDRADFGRLTAAPGLAVTAGWQQAWIGVDENGTEAAGAAGVASSVLSMCSYFCLTLDEPFLFVLESQDRQEPLFVGRVTDPTA